MSRLNRFLKPPIFVRHGAVFIDMELDLYRDFINFSEAKIEEELKVIEKKYSQFEKELESGTTDYEEEYIDHLHDHFIDEFHKINYGYIQNFRKSQIIQFYSFLETLLKSGCDRYSRYYKKEYKISDLKGFNDIDKIKKFLKKSMEIDIGDLQPEWDYINNLRKLRNIIVHHNGEIKPDHTDYKSIKNFSINRFELTGGVYSKSYSIKITKKDFLLEIPDRIFSLFQLIGKCEEKKLKSNK